MPRKCSVCESPALELINTMLNTGVPYREISDTHKLATTAVWRHVKHMQKDAITKKLTAAGVLSEIKGKNSRKLRNVQMDGTRLLRAALDDAVLDTSLTPLERSIAAIRSAEDLRNALQMLMLEAVSTYHLALGKDSLTQAIQALKTAGWHAVVLGKAQGWIVADPTIINDQRSVTLFGDLGKDAMETLKTVLEGVTPADMQRAAPEPKPAPPATPQLPGQLDMAPDLMRTAGDVITIVADDATSVSVEIEPGKVLTFDNEDPW